MPMPFAGQIEQGVTGAEELAALLGLEFPASAGDQRETKFPEHASFIPFETVIRGMAGAWIRLMRINFFPTGVRHVERLLKQLVIQGQGVGAGLGMSHIET